MCTADYKHQVKKSNIVIIAQRARIPPPEHHLHITLDTSFTFHTAFFLWCPFFLMNHRLGYRLSLC